MSETKPELVACPQCNATGEIVKPTPTPGAEAIRIKSPELAYLEGQLKTSASSRDGWRAIAEALLSVAFRDEMRGFSDVPPTELLAAVADRSDTNEVAMAIRDALTGRAWRVRGSKAQGLCDYPLCERRHAETRKLMAVQVNFNDMKSIALHVCDATGSECVAWAQWVSSRARHGTITIR